MRKRQIKKTVISYEDKSIKQEDQPQRSRQKNQTATVQVIDAASRRARLAMLRNKMHEEEANKVTQMHAQPIITVNCNLPTVNNSEPVSEGNIEKQPTPQHPNHSPQSQQNSENSDSEQNEPQQILKPVFISKQDREQSHNKHSQEHEQQRKKKAIKYTTKLLLLETAKQQEDDEILHSSDDDDFDKRTDIGDDDDQKEEELQYEKWKVRELKRLRRDKEERRKIQQQNAQILRRRKMNNEQILLENKVMGSDATDNTTQTKYVYLQKYYHKGAFYQDSQDPIFKRDYNLPTPLQMQDKSMLPQILQKRAGNFGKKGQGKYKHLTAQDTTNFDPKFRSDQSILNNWKKKTAGYKGAGGSNI